MLPRLMRKAARDVRRLAGQLQCQKTLYRWKSPTPAIPDYVDLNYRRTLDSGGEYFIEDCAYPRLTVSSGEKASAASQSSAAASGGGFSARARKQLQAPPAPSVRRPCRNRTSLPCQYSTGSESKTSSLFP